MLHRSIQRGFIAATFGMGLLLALHPTRTPSQAKTDSAERSRYQIDLKIDFDNRSYSGTERLRWVNRSDHSTSTIYFHLYANARSDQPVVAVLNPTSQNPVPPDADEPRIEINDVRQASTNASLPFVLDDQGTTLRVNLREAAAPNTATELIISFKGTVPEIEAEETGITTHVVKQVSAALRDEKETRRARDINFRCRGVMLLGTAYPVLAVREGDDWRRRIEPTVGDMILNEASDYEVTIETAPGVALYTSGTPVAPATGVTVKKFSINGSRDFTIIASRNLMSESATLDDTVVTSVFLPDHERVGKRVLTIATNAVRIFKSRFGALPFKNITIAEAPLVAGLGSTEFSGLDVIASAFCVDFDSSAMRSLPEIIREQRPAVEQSLEWSVARLVAHQWWGAGVGNDPAREAVLDEGLSNWSALLYYREMYGEAQATAVRGDQLVGVYRVYRTFGGEDMDANRPTRDYRNSLQYAAIVGTKSALMFVELEKLLGAERLAKALRSYYEANLFEIAELNDLRSAVVAEAPIDQRRTVARSFNRWLSSKRGDDDIAKPDSELAASVGLTVKPNAQKGGPNALTPFARFGKFFWQQMTRIH